LLTYRVIEGEHIVALLDLTWAANQLGMPNPARG